MQELTVEIRQGAGATPKSCALCDGTFQALSETAILFDGDLPLGHLCVGCLTSGPQGAASSVRKRAALLRDHSQRLHHSSLGQAWLHMMETMRHQAERWNTLAARIESLKAWNLRAAPDP